MNESIYTLNMFYSEELYKQTREEMSRLKSELKVLKKFRAEQTTPASNAAAKLKASELQQHYEIIVHRFNDLKRYRDWSQSAERELLYVNEE